MFLDGLAMQMVTIPIYYPVILGLGFDAIWFGVIAMIVTLVLIILFPQIALAISKSMFG